jgi:heptosyltransferase-2
MRLHDPGAELVLACRPGLGEFFLKYKLVDRVIEIDKKSGAGRDKALASLKGEVWDLIVCPHESPRTAWWMKGLRAREAKIGFAKWWNHMAFTKRVVKPVDYPDALRQLSLMTAVDSSLADLFGIEDMSHLKNPYSRRSPLVLDVPLIPEWASMKVLEPKPDGRTVFLAPGSVWPTKRWTENGYVGLASVLKARNFKIVLVGSPDERELCEKVAKEIPGVENRAGQTTLAGLVELFSTGVALVCNDSGAMHAAAAAGLPTVAIFGPTVLNQGFRPWNDRAVVVQRDIDCRPCGKHGAKKCPIGTHECMTQIFAEDVYTALADFMSSQKMAQ